MLSPSNLVHGLNDSEMAELINAIGFRLLGIDQSGSLAVDCFKLTRKIRANAFRSFPPITDEERNLFSVGKLAAAVVSYRNRTHKGLRDCKEMIEWACSLAATQIDCDFAGGCLAIATESGYDKDNKVIAHSCKDHAEILESDARWNGIVRWENK